MTFNDLDFKQRNFGTRGITAKLQLENGFVVSVIAGHGMGSIPRKNHESPDDYSAFEVAIFNSDGYIVTDKFFPNHIDGEIFFQTRDQINEIIKVVSSK